MPEHWRLGYVERSVLEALDQLGARPDRPHVKCARTVELLATDFGLSPSYGYGSLCAQSQTWLQNIPLVDFHGNNGSPDDDPANPRYTEARLSSSGALALAAERGAGPRVPVGLINGNLDVAGTAPPFSPTRVVATLLDLVETPSLSDAEIVERVGPPVSPTGCRMACDYAALGTGRTTSLVMTANVEYEAFEDEEEFHRAIVLTRLPLGVGAETVMQALAGRAPTLGDPDPDWDLGELALPLRDVRDMSYGDTERIVCVPLGNVMLEQYEAQIAATWGVRIRKQVQLPAPLPDLMRQLADEDPAALRLAFRTLSGG